MDLNDLNKTLLELETNLRNLESARKQVELVTSSSNEVVNSVSDLILQIEVSQKIIDSEIINKLSSITEEFSYKLNRYSNVIKSIIRTNTDSFNENLSVISSSVESIKTNVSNDLNSFNEKLKLLESNYKSSLNNSLDTFTERTGNISKDLKGEIATQFNKREKEFDRKIGLLEKQNKLIIRFAYVLTGLSVFGFGLLVYFHG